jgi:hypothetical protein
MDEFPNLAELSIPEKSDEGYPAARPDGEAKQILKRLRRSARVKFIAEPTTKLPISELSTSEMDVLNAFAAKVAGRADCKIRSIDGCHSCYLGRVGTGHGGSCDKWGNLVHTDCGLQCWLCAIECEGGNGN